MSEPIVAERQLQKSAPIAAEREVRFRTWHVFAILAAVNMLQLAYFNEFVLTREVYARLMGAGMDPSTVDQYFSATNRLARWGYLASPALLGLRVGFMALIIQFTLLLFFVELRFSQVFRAACWAYFPVVLGSAVQSVWLHRRAATHILSPEDFQYMPTSLASLIFGFPDADNRLYTLLNAVNVFEFCWCAILAVAVMDATKLKPVAAAAVITAVWAAVNLLKWGIALVGSGMVG